MSGRHSIARARLSYPKRAPKERAQRNQSINFSWRRTVIFRMSSPHLAGRSASRFLLLLMSSFPAVNALAQPDPPIPSGDIRIHYFRPDGNYSGWTVYAFDNTTENTGNYGAAPFRSLALTASASISTWASPLARRKSGSSFTIPLRPEATRRTLPTISLSIPPRRASSTGPTPASPSCIHVAPSLSNPTALLPGYVRVHYHRTDGNYSGWTDLRLLRHDRVHRRLQ